LWTSPAIQEWLATGQAFLWCDAAKRLKERFDPELLKRVKQANLEHTLCGGFASPDQYVLFYATMPSAQSGSAHLERFKLLAPLLVQASQHAFPSNLLTMRDTAMLRRRAMGEITREIAIAEGISERTVREHLQQVKKKLFTKDLVNAVVIAMKSGMLLPPWKNGI